MKKIRIVVIIICSFIIGFLVARPALKRHSEAGTCSNQMHAVLFAACRIWPDDNRGYCPPDFSFLSNEISNPMLLICPADHLRQAATNWATFSMSNNSSYEILAPGLEQSKTNTIFMRCKIHGFVGYPDDRLTDRHGNMIKPNRIW